MAVVVTITLKLKPEAYDGFCSGLSEMLKDTRQFKGCLGLYLGGNSGDHSVILYERWERIEDQKDYIAWRTARGEMDGMAAAVREAPKFEVLEDLFAA